MYRYIIYVGSVVFEYNMGILYSNICMQYIWIQYGEIVFKYSYTVCRYVSVYQYIWGSVSVLVLVYSVRYVGMNVWIHSHMDILMYINIDINISGGLYQ